MSQEEYRSRIIKALVLARDEFKQNPDADPDAVLESVSPRYNNLIGGETTCVEVEKNGCILVLDLGSGARALGLEIERRLREGELKTKDIYVLLTHTHWDHIQGLPLFRPAFDPGITLHFYSCLENCEERLVRQQHGDHCPVSFADLPCKKEFHHMKSGSHFQIGPFQISTQSLIHPGGSTSYKIEESGRSFIFATDTEFYGPDLFNLIQEYHAFFNMADLMIMDAQYSLAEAEQKKGWGHTAMTIAVDCSIHWKIKRLVLTHHEPAHTDDVIHELYLKASSYVDAYAENEVSPIKVILAREGDQYTL